MFNKKLMTLSILSAISLSDVYANISLPQGSAINALSNLQDISSIRYLNMANTQARTNVNLSLMSIKNGIDNKGKTLLLDFTMLDDPIERQTARDELIRKIGVDFDSDFILISRYKNQIMFTPIQTHDIHRIAEILEQVTKNSEYDRLSPREAEDLPQVAFYLNVVKPIKADECTFRNSHFPEWDASNRTFCDEDAGISLIYRVSYLRSLPFGDSGGDTPDAKIVRITLDKNSTGSGIHLNNRLNWNYQDNPDYYSMNGWQRAWSTDAIAQDYQFEFNASNDKARILRTFPSHNINRQYENTVESGFTVGIASSLEGPKAKLDASMSYTQQRSLSYNTQEYRIDRSTKNFRNVSFSWRRDAYPTADSMILNHSVPFGSYGYPADLNRIGAIGYKSFLPNLDIIYKAKPDESGTTEFIIDSSVNIMPLYHAVYSFHLLFWNQKTYVGFDNTPYRRVTARTKFITDWNHPVFTGGRPVNIQIGAYNNTCIETNTEGAIYTADCELTKAEQSFIYDQLGRYMSVAHRNQCVDGQFLDQLRACDASLSQRWEWIENIDHLSNKYHNLLLGKNKMTNRLGLYTQDDTNVSTRMITTYTNLFNRNISSSSPVLGLTHGQLTQQQIGQENKLYIRAGAAIDALGSDPELLIGGTGGSLSSVDLSGVTSIIATSGDFQYGGQQLVALTFNYQDGRQRTVGSNDYVTNAHQDRFDVPPSTPITQLKIWADDWLVKGVQFSVN